MIKAPVEGGFLFVADKGGNLWVNGTGEQVNISQGAMETLSEPYIVTDEPYTVNFSIDAESEYEYTNDTKITLANSYIRFSPTEAGSYKFCYQEPTN